MGHVFSIIIRLLDIITHKGGLIMRQKNKVIIKKQKPMVEKSTTLFMVGHLGA